MQTRPLALPGDGLLAEAPLRQPWRQAASPVEHFRRRAACGYDPKAELQYPFSVLSGCEQALWNVSDVVGQLRRVEHGQAPLDRGTPVLEVGSNLTMRGATFEPIGSGVPSCLKTLDTLNTHEIWEVVRPQAELGDESPAPRGGAVTFGFCPLPFAF